MTGTQASRWPVALGLVVPTLLASGCATASYQVVEASSQMVVHDIEAEAPGGEATVIVVYFDETTPPLVKAGVDSTDLVNATAAVGRRAVNLAMKLAPASP